MSPHAVPATEAAAPDLSSLCRSFAEWSPHPMVAVGGPTHVVHYLNPAFARLAGTAADDLVGRPFADALPEAAGGGCLVLLDRVFRTGVPESLTEQDHRRTPPAAWSYAAWPVAGSGGRPAGVMVQVTDATEAAAFRRDAAAVNEALLVSAVRQHELLDTIEHGERERREADARASQARRLESLGVLAGGIAHDLNNMLTPILGYAEAARAGLPDDAPAGPMLDAVAASARRAADLVQQILAYAGKGRYVVRPVDLSELVREMSGSLSSAVSPATELGYDLAPALPPAEADAAQLRQVVLYLVTNASEALDGRGGSVTVRTGVTPAAPGRHPPPVAAGRPAGPAVFLEVADTGCGMTADVVEKIFDPFFTTKFTGRGLGLAVVHGIARGHGGHLEVHSEPGRGSTFRLLLPCTAAAPPAVPRESDQWRGTGAVLVIDDDGGVRDIAGRILERAGLTVFAAGDGAEGVEVFREHRQEIDVVVLDLTMPGMGGVEAAGALRGLRADLPIIFMSGYTVEDVPLPAAGLGPTGFVQKPFTTADLVAAVRRAAGG